MADLIAFHAQQIAEHVPLVTRVGVPVASALLVIYLGRGSRDALLLAGVAATYGLSPYFPVLG